MTLHLGRTGLTPVVSRLVLAGWAMLAMALPARAQEPATPPALSTYRLQVGDQLRFELWAGEALPIMGLFPIESTGEAFLPRLGAVRAAGLTVEEFRRSLREAYARTYETAVVVVNPLFAVSVVGEARSPGIVMMTPGQTLFDAIAAAGGLTELAKRDQIQLVRGGQTTTIDAQETLEGISTLQLASGDRVIVPRARRFSTYEATLILQAVVGVVTIYTLLK